MAKKVLTYNLSQPLNGTKAAKIEINAGPGNLTIEKLTSIDQLLAGGTLQYLEGQVAPFQSANSYNGQTNLTLKAGAIGRSWFRLPWQACVGAFDWQIYLNSKVPSDLNVHTDGGNVKLDLAGMAITHLLVDTAGGNMDVVLPAKAANLNVVAKTGGGNVNVELGKDTTGRNAVNAGSGGGNVVVCLPDGIAARIQASTGLGKVMIDSRFAKIDKNLYQSSDYDVAANKVDLTAGSGAGNVTVVVE